MTKRSNTTPAPNSEADEALFAKARAKMDEARPRIAADAAAAAQVAAAEDEVDALRPEFADLEDRFPRFILLDLQAIVDCYEAIVAADNLDNPMPLFAKWKAFGRARLLSITLRDLYDFTHARIKRDAKKARDSANLLVAKEPDQAAAARAARFAESLTAAIWDRNASNHAGRIRDAGLAGYEVEQATEADGSH